jgi:multidrug resistance efflux pump
MKHAWLLLAMLTLHALPSAAATLKVDGEVYARNTATLMPPNIDDLWQFNINQLAPDGAPVKKGEVVLGFDGGEVMKRLTEKQSLLKEKQSQLDKLLLELAERERNECLATAEARANQDKARRKTAQPPELIAGIAYKKLLVSRQQAEQRMLLLARRQRLAGEQRHQERRLLAAEVAQLQAQVGDLQRAMAALNIVAPRDGLMMHKSSWGGDKFDVGTQTWRGQPVAEIPDTTTLAVRAELPERDLERVAVGASARIVLEGGAGRALHGRVSDIGRAVRSKSKVQPIPILDLQITLDNPRAQLKSGQAVRVELSVPDMVAASRSQTAPAGASR